MAGAVGFEPTVHDTKNRCLTTWLRPNYEDGAEHSLTAFSNQCFFKDIMGALRPPNPPSAERRAANFWRTPQHSAPPFSKTDDRLVNVIIMGASPHTPNSKC